jgi:hypothetical protein
MTYARCNARTETSSTRRQRPPPTASANDD